MNYLLVALGGALGSALRYLTVNVSGRLFTGSDFPYGTLIVNVTGCFVIAFLGALAAERIQLSSECRLFLFTGVLGGFTTFSAFGYETFHLMKTSQAGPAVVNIGANLVLGLGAVYIGYLCGKNFPG